MTDLWLHTFTQLIKVLVNLKEYVASLIGLYKNHGAVSCVGIYFLFAIPTSHLENHSTKNVQLLNCLGLVTLGSYTLEQPPLHTMGTTIMYCVMSIY